VLAYRCNGSLVTSDRPEGVVLGRMPEAVLQHFGDKMKEGLLLRFRVGQKGFSLDSNGDIKGADLQWVGVANQLRHADQISRIVFQWQLRTSQVRVGDLFEAVRRDAVDAMKFDNQVIRAGSFKAPDVTME
jgi:hypothetical protein